MYNDQAFLMMGKLTVYWYGIIIAAALFAGIISACRLRRLQSGSGSDMLSALLIALPLAFAVSRAYYCWNSPSQFTSFSQVFRFSIGGYALPGALLGAALGIILSAKLQRKKAGELLDAFAPAAAVTIAIGRMAAFFSGEFLGEAVTDQRLQRFPFSVFCEGEGLYRLAFFVWESVLCIILAAVFSRLTAKRYKEKRFSNPEGDIFLMFVTVYFTLHGIMEQFRNDPLYFKVVIYLRKLQTVPVTFAMGALFAALPLAIMILRNIARNGFKLRTLWHIPACGLLYFGYFNIILRIDSYIESLNSIVLVLCALGLVCMSIVLFLTFCTENREQQENPLF